MELLRKWWKKCDARLVSRDERLSLRWEMLSIDRTDSVPSKRQAVSSASIGDTLYVFGGGAMEGPYDNRLFSLQLSDSLEHLYCWNELQTTGQQPAARGVAAMTACTGTLFLFGGYDGREHLHDFHSCELEDDGTVQWQALPSLDTVSSAPSARRGATICAYGDALYLCGGSVNFGADAFDDLWCFQSGKWRLVLNTGVGMFRHSAVVHGDHMIVYGGDKGVGTNDELYTFSFGTETWSSWICPGDARPAHIDSHQAVVLREQFMVLWGGNTDDGPNSRVFALDLHRGKWLSTTLDTTDDMVPQPHPRQFFGAGTGCSGCAMLVAMGRHDSFVIREDCGYSTFEYFNDAWKLSCTDATSHAK